MGRLRVIKENLCISVRIEKDMYELMTEIATLESLNKHSFVSVQELIRGAVRYVYEDNERLRECFKRSRQFHSKRMK